MKPIVTKDVDQTVRVGYSGKSLGNTNPRFSSDGDSNFAKFTAEFPGKKVYDMPATGGDKFVSVDNISPDTLDKTEADVLVTTESSNLLVLKAADCIPLVFYVPGEKVLALAHIGTPGAKLHLPRKTVDTIGLPPAEIHVYAGPHIAQKSYRFPKDKWDKKLDDKWNKYLAEKDRYVHIDLLGFVLDELKDSGIKEENIMVEDIDTGGDPDYFSHRRHKLSGEPDGRNCFAVCLL